ncbi:MAG: Leu/Phe/Val dehydrogenase [Bacteriovoracia bacterium]
MTLFERIQNEGYEQIIYCQDKKTGLKAIISIHDSTLGPGVGGCRMYPYETEEQAIEDVLRLSKGMTYKASISGLDWGGAKAVIIGDAKKDKTAALLRRYAEFVDTLKGRYITAKDVGITGPDLEVIRSKTQHVLGIEGVSGSSGDPSILTAWGVYNGMKACANQVWGSPSLKGRRIAVQGLGYVSYYLLKHLAKEGASIVAADVDDQRIQKCRLEFEMDIVSPDEIVSQKCDIFSPNALGAILNSKSIPTLQCKIVAGAANNQLATNQDGYDLMSKDIVYAPDYAINAGGLINIYHEPKGYNSARAHDHVAGIYATIERILDRSKQEKIPPHIIADRIAEERIEKAKSNREI